MPVKQKALPSILETGRILQKINRMKEGAGIKPDESIEK